MSEKADVGCININELDFGVDQKLAKKLHGLRELRWLDERVENINIGRLPVVSFIMFAAELVNGAVDMQCRYDGDDDGDGDGDCCGIEMEGHNR